MHVCMGICVCVETTINRNMQSMLGASVCEMILNSEYIRTIVKKGLLVVRTLAVCFLHMQLLNPLFYHLEKEYTKVSL